MSNESRLTSDNRLKIARLLASSHLDWELCIVVDGHAIMSSKYRGLLCYGDDNYEFVEINSSGEYCLIEGDADHVVADEWLIKAFDRHIERVIKLRAEIREET